MLTERKPKAAVEKPGETGFTDKHPEAAPAAVATVSEVVPGMEGLDHGAVVVAAITSCTNTSNPSVMIGAGLVARNAVRRGLKVKPWVKTSLAPGSLIVTEYYKASGLLEYLAELGFNIVGYGCTTCIGNSGPLPEPVSTIVKDRNLIVASVLSGNRNFEGRIQSQVRANYLASPPLVVAYALAGRMQIDMTTEPLGEDQTGTPVYLKDLWPSEREIQETMLKSVKSEMFREQYATVFDGDARWRSLPSPSSERFVWDDDSTYIRNPPFFDGLTLEPTPPADIVCARALAVLGDSVTTDHISPAGSIPADSPAGRYLISKGVAPADFNSYGARRGNHEVMMRGTFANIRLRNQLAPGTEGGWTTLLPEGEVMTIYDASVRYRDAGVPLHHHRRQGVRVGIVARLGRQGDAAARRQGGDRRELRAHSPQQPGEHGRAAAGVPGRRDRRVAEDHRPRALRHHRDGRDAAAARRGHGPRDVRGRIHPGHHGDRADRHARGARRVPQRRDPALRRPAADEVVTRARPHRM